MKPIKIMIADDHSIIRDGFQTILELQEGFEVVGTARNGRTAVELASAAKPDVVLLDLHMPDMNGLEAAKLIKGSHPSMQILILTSQHDDELIIKAMIAGASGFILKDWETADIVRAIQAVASGQLVMPNSIAGKLSEGFARLETQRTEMTEDDIARLANRQPWEKLDAQFSARERQIIYLLLQERSNVEIAESLHLSVGTVKNYISLIFKALGASGRSEAARLIKERFDT